MDFDDFMQKPGLVVVFTGEGKGKTSAALGLMCRALGAGWSVAFLQFIKHWEVNEHKFINQINSLYNQKLYFYKGGKGFYKAKQLSAKNVNQQEHKQAALATYKIALELVSNGNYGLVICDEINNAVHDGLLPAKSLIELISKRHQSTSLCLTGRHFPTKFIDGVDIVTNMTKIKHHFDDGYIANEGIDY